MVLKTLPKTDYSCSPSICRALHESDCALATSNQCQANNVQNVLRNTIQSRGGCGPRSPSSSVPSSPNSKTVKISSQLATPQSANIERRQAADSATSPSFLASPPFLVALRMLHSTRPDSTAFGRQHFISSKFQLDLAYFVAGIFLSADCYFWQFVCLPIVCRLCLSFLLAKLI